MRVTESWDIGETDGCTAAIGFFDGVHLGHRAVIGAAVEAARRRGLPSVVFSFSTAEGTLPVKGGVKLLQSEGQRQKALEELGVDLLIAPDFAQIRDLTPERYARELLWEALGARAVFCGYDYRFGKGAAAGAQELSAYLAPFGVAVHSVPAVLDGGKPVSSTRIRQALERGDAAEAARLLGRPFAFELEVAHGRRLGRKLGFPTANQPFSDRMLCPRFGVYASTAVIDGKRYSGVTNIGIKPTVGSDNVSAESYFIGFDGELYGKTIETSLLRFLRPERRFPSLDALREQIEADARRAGEGADGWNESRV